MNAIKGLEGKELEIKIFGSKEIKYVIKLKVKRVIITDSKIEIICEES